MYKNMYTKLNEKKITHTHIHVQHTLYQFKNLFSK